MRHNLRVLAATELPENAREAGRTEVLPVQWRKHLRLDVRPLAPRLLPYLVYVALRTCMLSLCICMAHSSCIWCHSLVQLPK